MSIPDRIRQLNQRAGLPELLLWCLPALIIGGVLRLMLLIHFPYAYVHPDSQDFLITASRYLAHRGFVLHGKKSWLGPILFMAPMIVHIPTLLIAAWVQHAFGLICVVMMGALVRCWTRLWHWWIVPVTVLAAINPSTLYYEHALIAEAQYLWCVTGLALAGTIYALAQTRARFITLMVALFLTAGSRPEGKLYVLFCLALVPLLLWGHWRKFAIYGAITLALCMGTWLSTRNTQAGLLLYATVLPLAPDTPKSAPDFGPVIAPVREARLQKGVFAMPDLVKEEKSITNVLNPWMKSEHLSTKDSGAFCQRLAVEAALHHPLLLAPMALVKFLTTTRLPSDDGFENPYLQVQQLESATFKPWMLKLMPRLTGLKLESKEDVAAYIQRDFAPLQPDWFAYLQKYWLIFTRDPGIRVPGLPAGTPGLPLYYAIFFVGMIVAIVRPGPMQKLHIAWVIGLCFTAFVVILTGVLLARYRFVFEPFGLLYGAVLLDAFVSIVKREPARVDGKPAP